MDEVQNPTNSDCEKKFQNFKKKELPCALFGDEQHRQKSDSSTYSLMNSDEGFLERRLNAAEIFIPAAFDINNFILSHHHEGLSMSGTTVLE
jgi:hypothetical protein